MLPCTVSASLGAVVLIPTLPSAAIRTRSVLFVSNRKYPFCRLTIPALLSEINNSNPVSDPVPVEQLPSCKTALVVLPIIDRFRAGVLERPIPTQPPQGAINTCAALVSAPLFSIDS